MRYPDVFESGGRIMKAIWVIFETVYKMINNCLLSYYVVEVEKLR